MTDGQVAQAAPAKAARPGLHAMDRAELEASFSRTLANSGRMGQGAARQVNPGFTLRATVDELSAVLGQLAGTERTVSASPTRNLDVIEVVRAFRDAIRQPVWRRGDKDPATGRPKTAERTDVVRSGEDGLRFVAETFGPARNLTRRVHFDKDALKEILAAMPSRADVEAAVRRFRSAQSASIAREGGAEAAKRADRGMGR